MRSRNQFALWRNTFWNKNLLPVKRGGNKPRYPAADLTTKWRTRHLGRRTSFNWSWCGHKFEVHVVLRGETTILHVREKKTGILAMTRIIKFAYITSRPAHGW